MFRLKLYIESSTVSKILTNFRVHFIKKISNGLIENVFDK